MAKDKKIMFLCAHNQSRSVTAEGLLTGTKGYEVKSRALWHGTPRKITKHEGQWADEVYVMMPGMIPVAEEAGVNKKKIKSLWIPDDYVACEDKLLRELKSQLASHGIFVTKSLEKAKQDCWKIHDRKMGYSMPRGFFDFEFGKFQTEERGSRDLEIPPRYSLETVGGGQISPSHYVPVSGDESEEEIVERARRLWKFYDSMNPKQERLDRDYRFPKSKPHMRG